MAVGFAEAARIREADTNRVSDAETLRLRDEARAAAVARGRHPGTVTRAELITASVAYYLALHPDDARWLEPKDGLPRAAEIRERADVAYRAQRDLPRTGRIDPDPKVHDRWLALLGWSERVLAMVYTPDFAVAYRQVKAGDPAGLEYVLRFLEADPWCHGSGYTKAKLIPAIVRLDLDEPTRARLRRVALAVVDDPRPRREVRRYGQLARAVATPELEADVRKRLESTDPQVGANARWVLDEMHRRSADRSPAGS